MKTHKRDELMKIIADFMADNIKEDAVFLVIVATPDPGRDAFFDSVSNIPSEGQRIMLQDAIKNIDANSGTSEIYHTSEPPIIN